MGTETSTETVTEFEDGSKIIETTTVESEFVEGDNLEPLEILEAVTEPVTDAAVQIAQIEAERDITIAAIHADIEQVALEVRSEEQGDNEWRQNLESRLDNLTSQVETLSILLQSSNSEPNPQQNPASEPASDVPTLDSQEPQTVESAPEPAPKRAKKSRWI